MFETDPEARLLDDEVESWKPFVDALRSEDREVAKRMIQKAYRFAGAVESSRKRYVVEPFFLSLLVAQEGQISWLESELATLREEIEAWKKKAGY